MKINHGDTFEGHYIFIEGNILVCNPKIFRGVTEQAKLYLRLRDEGYKFLFSSQGALFFEIPKDLVEKSKGTGGKDE